MSKQNQGTPDKLGLHDFHELRPHPDVRSFEEAPEKYGPAPKRKKAAP